jgi:hypothetical protein
MRRLTTRSLVLPWIALAPVSLGAQEIDQSWTVYLEETPIRVSPSGDSQQVGTLRRGDRVRGEISVNPETDEEWLVFARDGRSLCVSSTALVRVHPANVVEGDIPIGEGIANRWWGMPFDYDPSDLVEIPSRFCSNENRTHRLRQAARDALVEMLEAALRDDVEIHVASAHRSAERQRRLYEGAVRRRGPGQRSSARPGHSEHQLGTTLDLTDPAGDLAFSQEFSQGPQGQWLREHAAEFGFTQSYTETNAGETGYIPEPWHWRFRGRPSPTWEPTAPSGGNGDGE